MTAIEIIRAYAVAARTTPEVLRSKRFTRTLFMARRHVYALLRSERGMSYPQIGSLMGGRDHSTIMRALNPVRRQATIDRMKTHHQSRRAGASAH